MDKSDVSQERSEGLASKSKGSWRGGSKNGKKIDAVIGKYGHLPIFSKFGGSIAGNSICNRAVAAKGRIERSRSGRSLKVTTNCAGKSAGGMSERDRLAGSKSPRGASRNPDELGAKGGQLKAGNLPRFYNNNNKANANEISAKIRGTSRTSQNKENMVNQQRPKSKPSQRQETKTPIPSWCEQNLNAARPQPPRDVSNGKNRSQAFGNYYQQDDYPNDSHNNTIENIFDNFNGTGTANGNLDISGLTNLRLTREGTDSKMGCDLNEIGGHQFFQDTDRGSLDFGYNEFDIQRLSNGQEQNVVETKRLNKDTGGLKQKSKPAPRQTVGNYGATQKSAKKAKSTPTNNNKLKNNRVGEKGLNLKGPKAPVKVDDQMARRLENKKNQVAGNSKPTSARETIGHSTGLSTLGKTAEKLKKMQQNVVTYQNRNSRSVRDHQPKSPRLAERYQHSDEVDFIHTEQTCRPQNSDSKNPGRKPQANFAKSLGIQPNQNPHEANPKKSNFTYAGAKTLRVTKASPKPTTKDQLKSTHNPKPNKKIFSNSFDNTMPSSEHQTQLDKENLKKKYSREIVGSQTAGFENFFLGRNTVGPQVYNHLYQDEEEIPNSNQNFIKDYRQQNFSLRG